MDTTGGKMEIITSGTYIPQEPKLLGSLGCYHYKLKEPLEFKVDYDEDGVIAFVDEPIAEYGYGKTESEALDDLRTSIIDYFESLKNHKHQLAQGLKKELRWLEHNIEVKWSDH